MTLLRFLLVLLPGVLLAQGEENAQLAAKAEGLSPEIETVATGGYWERDNQDGSFRLVIQCVGWEELGSRAFLQWIRADHEKQETVIERTIPIKEIGGRWRVSSQKFVFRGKETNIIISATRRSPPGQMTLTIVPSANFSYTVTVSDK